MKRLYHQGNDSFQVPWGLRQPNMADGRVSKIIPAGPAVPAAGEAGMPASWTPRESDRADPAKHIRHG